MFAVVEIIANRRCTGVVRQGQAVVATAGDGTEVLARRWIRLPPIRHGGDILPCPPADDGAIVLQGQTMQIAGRHGHVVLAGRHLSQAIVACLDAPPDERAIAPQGHRKGAAGADGGECAAGRRSLDRGQIAPGDQGAVGPQRYPMGIARAYRLEPAPLRRPRHLTPTVIAPGDDGAVRAQGHGEGRAAIDRRRNSGPWVLWRPGHPNCCPRPQSTRHCVSPG